MGGAKQIGEKGALEKLADELGVSPQQIVLAWHLAQYERELPIPGASRVQSVEDSAQAADIELSSEQVEMLTKSFKG